MIYKLFNEPQYSSLIQVMINRGLEYDAIDTWWNADISKINSPYMFGPAIVGALVHRICLAAERQENITVIVDSDADGFTSAAIIINYMYAT